MTAFGDWVRRSREMETRTPKRYLAHYKNLVDVDGSEIYMTRETYDKLKRECGQYDGTFPTGEYLGKIFLRRGYFCWFGATVAGVKKVAGVSVKSKKIVILDG